MKVPLLDLKEQYKTIKEEILKTAEDVFESQYFILGPKVKALEEEIAEYCSTAHAVGVSSGTDALLISLMAADIAAQDTVITSPYTFFATAGCVARTGARPIFVDIDPQTYNISPELLERGFHAPKTSPCKGGLRWGSRLGPVDVNDAGQHHGQCHQHQLHPISSPYLHPIR